MKRKAPPKIYDSWNIFDGLFGRLSTDDQFVIFHEVLQQWLSRSLLSMYSIEDLDFYDGVLGFVIKNCNQHAENKRTGRYWHSDDMLDFMQIWGYQGQLYRVIDAPVSKIRFHKKIASWTSSTDSFHNFNHLVKTRTYTFLVANTGSYYGFDVNAYDKYMQIGRCTTHENEVIFPMNKKNIQHVFRGTLKEFKQFCAILNLDNKNDAK